MLIQVVHHILDEHGQVVPDVVDPVALLPGSAGVDDAHQLCDHVDDNFFVRMGEMVDFVDSTATAIVLQNGVHDPLYLFFHGCHWRSPP